LALFTSLASAENRVRAKIADGTWRNGHACLATLESGGNPVFAVRVQRKMSSASAGSRQNGGWIEITQDNVT